MNDIEEWALDVSRIRERAESRRHAEIIEDLIGDFNGNIERLGVDLDFVLTYKNDAASLGHAVLEIVALSLEQRQRDEREEAINAGQMDILENQLLNMRSSGGC